MCSVYIIMGSAPIYHLQVAVVECQQRHTSRDLAPVGGIYEEEQFT